ncbi:MAG: VgrG-related protein [Chloroflexota bacterium]
MASGTGKFVIKLGTADKSEDLIDVFDEIIVDTSLHLPDMFTIRVEDKLDKFISNGSYALGKPIEIKAYPTGDLKGDADVLITGEITSLEPNFLPGGQRMFTVRGYDQSHRMHMGRKSRTFLGMTDKKIVEEVMKGYSKLTPKAEDAKAGGSAVDYEYVLQRNQTDMEFLTERAQRLGFQAFVQAGDFNFTSGDKYPSGTPLKLEYPRTLRSFRVRMTAAHQASGVTVRGWDMVTNAAVVGTATPNDSLKQGGQSESGGDIAKSDFKAVDMVMVDYPASTKNEATVIANGMANDLSREFVEAEGVCYGLPKLRAGMMVEITKVGKFYNGKYYVTSATHIYTSSGYETHFVVSGRKPQTIHDLLGNHRDGGDNKGRIPGVVIGVVSDIKDGEATGTAKNRINNLGRVKVNFPWMVDTTKTPTTEIVSAWARMASPMAGADKGFFMLPEVKDEVLVAFEHGDPNKPYVLGTLWNGKQKPPVKNADVITADGKKVTQRLIQTPLGNKLVFDDEAGAPGAPPVASGITITDKEEKNFIKWDFSSGEIMIKAEKNLTIDAGGDIYIKSGGKFLVEAAKDIAQQSKQGKFTAIAQMALEMQSKTGNAIVQANAGTAYLDGATATNLAGATVNIKGDTAANMSATTINLNPPSPVVVQVPPIPAPVFPVGDT